MVAALAGCLGGDGGGGRGGEPPPAQPTCASATLDAPLCTGAACIFAAEGALSCDDDVFVELAPRGTDAPLVLLDTYREDAAPLLADPITGDLAALDGVSLLARLALDAQGQPLVSFTDLDEWYLETPTGNTEVISASSERTFSAARALAVVGASTVAVAHDGDWEAGLVLATRSPDGWSFEGLYGAHAWDPRLAVADDGTPVVAYKISSLGELRVHTRGVGSEVLDAGPFSELDGLDVIAGESSWQAVFYQTPDHLGVARPGQPPLLTAAGTFPFMYYPSSCPDVSVDGATVAQSCSESVSGVTSGPVAIRGASGSLNAFVILKRVVRSGHYEPSCAGCEASLVIDEDTSDSFLVRLQVTRVDGVDRLEEVARYPLHTGYDDVMLFGQQTAGGAALALSSKGRVRYAALDLSRL